MIQLYGTERCHKTQYYKAFFNAHYLKYVFIDVQKELSHATALRNLYAHKKLHFPTISIGSKTLRNPTEKELQKWIQKLK